MKKHKGKKWYSIEYPIVYPVVIFYSCVISFSKLKSLIGIWSILSSFLTYSHDWSRGILDSGVTALEPVGSNGLTVTRQFVDAPTIFSSINTSESGIFSVPMIGFCNSSHDRSTWAFLQAYRIPLIAFLIFFNVWLLTYMGKDFHWANPRSCSLPSSLPSVGTGHRHCPLLWVVMQD